MTEVLRPRITLTIYAADDITVHCDYCGPLHHATTLDEGRRLARQHRDRIHPPQEAA